MVKEGGRWLCLSRVIVEAEEEGQQKRKKERKGRALLVDGHEVARVEEQH